MENEEKKENWFKKNWKVCAIAAVVVVAIAAIVVVILMNQKDSPEKVMESYVKAMGDANVDEMVKITDLKGAYAWEKCGKDPSKFAEEYKNAASVDMGAYEGEFKNSLESGLAMLKSFGGIQITINKIEQPEKLADNLFAVKANVKMKMSFLGKEQEQDQDMSIAVYNGKFIGEYSK